MANSLERIRAKIAELEAKLSDLRIAERELVEIVHVDLGREDRRFARAHVVGADAERVEYGIERLIEHEIVVSHVHVPVVVDPRTLDAARRADDQLGHRHLARRVSRMLCERERRRHTLFRGFNARCRNAACEVGRALPNVGQSLHDRPLSRTAPRMTSDAVLPR